MPSISLLAVALLAVQAIASPSPAAAHRGALAHRRHHARHARRGCRVKPPSSTGLAVGSGGASVSDAVSAGASSNVTSASSVSAVASLTDASASSATSSHIGHELIVTGSSSAVTTEPTHQSIDPNDPNPVSGFVSSSAAQTEGQADKGGLIDISLSLGIGIGGGHSSTAAPTPSASATASVTESESESSVSSSLNVSSAIPSSSSSVPTGPTNDKRVFAHYMVGIVSQFQQADWEKEMTIAKAHAIDGFALNIGVDDYTQKQLDNAYAAASVVDFDLFISFDFNWYSTSDVHGVSTMLARYMDHDKQYKVDGKPFVSTFIGDGFDWGAVEQQLGKPIYSVPFYEPSSQNAQLPSLSGLFSWAAWPGQQGNVPVKQAMTDDRDLLYMSFTEPVQKDYMAPVSPWFFTHFGKEVPYSKNWLFYSETLWYDRWEQILKLQDKLRFLEIVTWNDYGESHYIGPLDTPHSDDGSSRYTKGLDHTAHLEFAVPYIKAFKTGAAAPVIEQDMLVYWYRPHLKNANCDATDNCGAKPDGWDMVSDEVFIATMTKNGGSFSVTSGGNAVVTEQAAAGVQIFRVPMGVGEQSFTFTANGAEGSDTSSVPISADCWNGIYNFNYHSGSIKL